MSFICLFRLEIDGEELNENGFGKYEPSKDNKIDSGYCFIARSRWRRLFSYL